MVTRYGREGHGLGGFAPVQQPPGPPPFQLRLIANGRGDAYHVTAGYPPQGGGGGGPSGGPQMRTMSMAPMTQTSQQQGPAPTSTPPTDLSKLQHMQGPGHMPHSSQMQLPFGPQRPNAPNYGFTSRAPAPRMSNRNPMFSVSGNGQQMMTTGQIGFMPYQTAALPILYPTAPTSRINSTGSSYYGGHQPSQVILSTPFNSNYMYYPTAIRTATSQGNMPGPHQGQQGVQPPTQHGPTPQVSIMPMQPNMMTGVNTPTQGGGSTAPAPNPTTRRRKHALDIIDPDSGRNVVEEMEKETTTSGGSSNRETPQPEPSQNQNHDVAAEFAERVNKAASEDSAPTAPPQPPDPSQSQSQSIGSINGPTPTEPNPELALSQPSFVDETGNLGTPWNKGMGHKGPGDISEKPHDSPQLYYYSAVIPSHPPNVSAKTVDISPDMYQSAGIPVPIMLHTPIMTGRQGSSLTNSLAINEQTPVVSANTNAPSLPVELYREPYSRGPQQTGSGGSSGHQGHPSPNRRKRQESNVVPAPAPAAPAPVVLQSAGSAPSLEANNSQGSDAKHSKKGSPTPGSASSQGRAPGAGSQKEGKRDKGRERASTPKEKEKEKESPKEILQPEPKGKTSPATIPAAVTAPVLTSAATAPTVPAAPVSPSPASPSASPSPQETPVASSASGTATPPAAAVDTKVDKSSRQASSESLTESDAKPSSRNKGKKMRDSNTKATEKDGSDVETHTDLTVESSTSPAPTLTEPAPVPTPIPAPTSTPTPTPEDPESCPVVEAVGDSMEQTPEAPVAAAAPAPAPPEPDETAVALKSVTETPASVPVTPAPAPASEAPASVEAATPDSEAAPAPVPAPATATTPAPTPAPVAAPPNPLSLKTVNMFNPDFLHSPTTPPITSKSFSKRVADDGEKEDAEKEDKMVSAKNEENKKDSGMNKDEQTTEKKRTYGADQWSPLNPEGKKKYDRGFLMELRDDPQSLKKPDGLPDMDVVLKESNKKAMQNSFSSEFSPAGFIRSSGSRGPPPKRNSQQGKPKQGKPAMVHLSISLRENVKLHETENAWKPAVLGAGKDSTEDEAATQDMYKRFRGILNKLTPEKFDRLVSQVQELPIDTLERLKGVINLVFDKAVDEPNFSVAYAKLCCELRSKEVQIDSNSEEKSSFRKILITRCQQEFEKNKAAENNKDDKKKEIEAEPDPEKRKELLLLFEDEERRVRMKSVGNIRFIGELYKLGMLTAQIMHRCVDELLSKNDEESLECLCKLLTTIGKKLEFEYPKGPEVLNEYFFKMKELTDKKGKGRKVSSRVRFMLQDVLDLRANKWVPRRDDSNPKTMDQIQKEAERELDTSIAALSQPNTPRKDDRGRGMDKRGGRGGQSASEDGWKTAASRSRAPLDVSKLRTSKVDNESLGSPNQFSRWGVGSTVKETSLSKKPTIINSNPYAALDKPIYNNPENFRGMSSLPSSKERYAGGEKVSNSRSSSQQRGSSQPTSRDSSSVRGERDDERRNRVPAPFAVPPEELVVDERPSAPETGTACPKRLEDPKEIERCALNLMKELLNHEDIQEAALAVKDYFDASNMTDFVRESMLFMCDRTNGHHIFSKFLLHLFKEKCLHSSHLVDVLSEIIESGPDLVIDIPKVWMHMAAMIAPLLIGEAITFKELAKVSEVLKSTPSAGVLLKNIFEVLIKETTPSWIKQKWDSSNVSWTDFLAASDVEEFIKQNHLETFSSGTLASRPEMSQQEIQEKLADLLKPESVASFDAIVEWIEANVGEKTCENFFIRALMTAICEYAIKESPSGRLCFEVDRFKTHEKLITRYVNAKANLELQCLYAIQALVNRLQHPQGLILSIFSSLWDQNTISSEAFLAWFSSQDPHEVEGQGVCRTSLTSFQTMLKETDDADDDDS